MIVIMPEIDLSATVDDPSFIGYEEEEPTFPTLDEQTLHQDNQQPPSTSALQLPAVIPAIRDLEEAQLPPAKKKRRPREVEPISLDKVDDGMRRLRSTTASQAVQEQRPPVPSTTAPALKTTSAGKKTVQATTTARTTRSAATGLSAGRARGGAPRGVSSAASSNRKSSRHVANN